jgi:gliding motility-associated lipoprotein GldH
MSAISDTYKYIFKRKPEAYAILSKPFYLCILYFSFFFLSSCQHIDLYEKTAVIPKAEWKSSFQPSFTFNITDTAAGYQLYIVLRHTEEYNYNNIWLKLHIQAPGDTATTVQFPLMLATADKGWLGNGMDDIYEHRILLTSSTRLWHFKKAGAYHFSLQQIMRDDPLEHVMNAGLRIEKVNN